MRWLRKYIFAKPTLCLLLLLSAHVFVHTNKSGPLSGTRHCDFNERRRCGISEVVTKNTFQIR